MADAPVVEPLSGGQPPAIPTPTAPPQDEAPDADLPEELIKIPAVQAVVAGSPPAVSMRIKGSENRDEVKLLSENKDALMSTGMGFYRSMSGEIGVMFNGMRIHPEDLKAADKAGKLLQVAPDFDTVNHEVSKSGTAHPILNAAPPTGFAPPTAAAPPQSASGALPLSPPPPASVARKLAAARVLNTAPGAPTTGPSPGAGRLLNSVLKGVV